jgi:isopentenyl-diphosphate delta-isomerase
MRSEVVSFEDDLLITVDTSNRVTGAMSKQACHVYPGVLHRAFSVFLFNEKGEVLLQKRSAHKKLWPGYWANSCCSHPREGEDMLEAAHRRTWEELGVRSTLKHLFDFTYQAHYLDAGSEYEHCSVFAGNIQGVPSCNMLEIESCAFMAPDALKHELACNGAQYTPWLHLEWPRVVETMG